MSCAVIKVCASSKRELFIIKPCGSKREGKDRIQRNVFEDLVWCGKREEKVKGGLSAGISVAQYWAFSHVFIRMSMVVRI